LAIELMASAARRRIRVHQGECVPLGANDSSIEGRLRGAPLHPFRPLLRAVADYCQRHGERATERLLGPRLGVLAAYAPELRTVPGAERFAEVKGLSDEAAQRRVLSDLASTMNQFASDDPFVLVLDDIQWADPLTMAWLEAVGSGDLELGGVFLLATYRSESRRPELADLRALDAITCIDLEPLSSEAVASIVEDML